MHRFKLNKEQYALVDDDKVEELMVGPKWYAIYDEHSYSYYARREITISKNVRKSQWMHRFILPGFAIVDHIDHNGLNNTSENLRGVSHSQSAINRRPFRNCSSKYKGVSKGHGGYVASIQSNGKRLWLGCFKDEKEAAKAYDEQARTLHGDWGWFNFPKGNERGGFNE